MFQALEKLVAEAIAATDVSDSAGAVIERNGIELRPVDLRFAGQIATSVWLGYLTELAAREALLSYAIACQLSGRSNLIRLREALLDEYRLCRERQDLVS